MRVCIPGPESPPLWGGGTIPGTMISRALGMRRGLDGTGNCGLRPWIGVGCLVLFLGVPSQSGNQFSTSFHLNIIWLHNFHLSPQNMLQPHV